MATTQYNLSRGLDDYNSNYRDVLSKIKWYTAKLHNTTVDLSQLKTDLFKLQNIGSESSAAISKSLVRQIKEQEQDVSNYSDRLKGYQNRLSDLRNKILQQQEMLDALGGYVPEVIRDWGCYDY